MMITVLQPCRCEDVFYRTAPAGIQMEERIADLEREVRAIRLELAALRRAQSNEEPANMRLEFAKGISPRAPYVRNDHLARMKATGPVASALRSFEFNIKSFMVGIALLDAIAMVGMGLPLYFSLKTRAACAALEAQPRPALAGKTAPTGGRQAYFRPG
jgi:hypothetical protein